MKNLLTISIAVVLTIMNVQQAASLEGKGVVEYTFESAGEESGPEPEYDEDLLALEGELKAKPEPAPVADKPIIDAIVVEEVKPAPAPEPIIVAPSAPMTERATDSYGYLLTEPVIEEEKEHTRPPGIEEIYEKMKKIEEAFGEAKMIPLPENKKRVVEPEDLTPLLSSDEILQSVIPLENQTKTMDLDFDETSLDSILHTIGDVADINIVLDPALKGNTLDLHLKKVLIRDALTILADSYNLAFKRVGNSLFVTTKDRIRADNLTTRVIKLRYIKASEVKTMTHNLLETINVSEDTNSLVVVGTADEIKKIEDLVRRVDVPQPQVILEAKIIEINKDALKDLGVDWSDTITTSFQESGRPTTFADTEDAPGSAFKLYSFARNPIQFDAVIRVLENDNKAKVLSNPRIITLNNQESEIFVGDRIPYTITTVTGGVATTEVRFVEPGIRLRITPSIIDEDFVVIKIEPEVSFIFSFRGPQDQYPWVKTRNATAFVRVSNRQPFVLGGLLNQEDKKNFFKVPILGDVPLLGNLFSYQKHTAVDTELIITVTPVIINQ